MQINRVFEMIRRTRGPVDGHCGRPYQRGRVRVQQLNSIFYHRKVLLVINKSSKFLSFLPSGLAPACALVMIMTALQALPADWRGYMAYDRALVSDGQLWRLLTSNFVHLGWGHLALNASGLLVMAWLFADDLRTLQWLGALTICSVVTAGGLYLFNPEILWCVGLSGVLHGLFIVGAIAWMERGIGPGKWLLVGIAVKLTWEQIAGEMPFSGDIVGGPVVVDAHLWGSVGGLIAVSIDALWRRARARL